LSFPITRLPPALQATIGLAVVGQVFVLLGAGGVLRGWVSIGLLGCWVAWLLGCYSATKQLSNLATLLLAALPLIALALYPPIAFDETLYHLPMVRAVAQSGAIRFLTDVRFPIFPQLHELLCVPVFIAFGDTATHLVAVVEVLLIAGIVCQWGSAGFLAAALVLGNPIVMQLGSVTHVEAALTLFVVAGFYCLDHDRPILAGFLLGTACSVKYLGLYFAAAALVYAWRKAARVLLGVALGVLPMYGLIVHFTGNPVFPFFGSSPWNIHVSHTPANIWRVFWDISFARDRVNWQPPYSPLFAISIAITLLAATRSRKAAFLSALCAGYIAIFAFLPQDSRYLLPLLPLVSVAAATVIAKRLNAIVALSLIAILPGPAYAGYRLAKQGIVPRQQYLEAHIPELRALEHRGPGRIWVCGAEQLKYYGGDDLVGDVVGPYRTMPPDARYVLIAHGKCAAPPGFTRVYADAAAELWSR